MSVSSMADVSAWPKCKYPVTLYFNLFKYYIILRNT